MRNSALSILCTSLAVVLLGCPTDRPQPSHPEPDSGIQFDGGDGGLSDAGASAEVIVDLSSTLSPEVQRFFRGLEQASLGEPADLDGNGTPDLFTERLDNGTVRTWFDDNEDGVPEFVFEALTDGSFREESDSNQDGQLESIRTYTKSDPSVLVTLSDEDHDGRMEKRETITYYAPARDAFRVLTEEDSDGDGAFTVLSDVTREPAFAPQGLRASALCDPKAGVPQLTDLSPKTEVPPATALRS